MDAKYKSILKTIITGSAWSFIGVLLAVGFFSWKEYENPFQFRIEIVDEFNLVEVREQIEDLKIIYKNEDILTSNKQIKVIRITFRNIGETILQQYYDQLEPFGLRFEQAKILNVEVTNSNSQDIKKKILPAKVKQNMNLNENDEFTYDELILSKVIFEEGKYVTFKIR